MKNEAVWQPSKFLLHDGLLMSSRDPDEVNLGSLFIGDILGRTYQQMIERHARGRLIDLGCGKCPLYTVYRHVISEVICVDWPGTLHKSPFLDFEADLNEPLSLDSDSFDTVLMTDVLEHIRKPVDLIREINRILRPGGKLLLSVPFFYWLHESPYDYFRYTRFTLSDFCDAAGLNVEELFEYGGLPEIFLDMIAKTIGYRAGIARSYARIAGWFAHLPPISRFSEKTRDKFPLGYVLVASKPA